MKKSLLIFLLLTGLVSGQTNLVPNPSFEIFTNCPTTLDQLNYSTGWSSYRGSPDYFNACNTATDALGIPSNAVGYQPAFSGQAYAGFVAFATGGEAREIIGGALNQTLTIGQTYYVSFYISLAEYDANYKQYIACNKIGARFSTVSADGSDNPYPGTNPTAINNFSQIYTNTIINDTMNWVRITGSFVADSAYKYFMIGNLFDDNNTDTIYRPNGVRSYYFIDEICVSTSSNTCNQITGTVSKEVFEKNELILFPNPTCDFFSVRSNQPKTFELILIDKFGRTILTHKINSSTKIDVSLLPSGLYFIKLSDGLKTYYDKIIICH